MKARSPLYITLALVLSSANGQTPYWQWAFHAPTNEDHPHCIATDATGAIYAAGGFSDTTSIGTETFINPCASYLTRLDADGNIQWAEQIGGLSDCDIITDISPAEGNGVYITGEYESDTLILVSDTLLPTATGWPALFFARIDENGIPVWADSPTLFGAGFYPRSRSIASDNQGALYATGSFAADSIAFGSIVLPPQGGSLLDNLFLVKYNSNGEVQWARSAYATSNGIATDETGNVYLTGTLIGGDPLIIDSDTLTGTAQYGNGFVVKFDTDGVLLWSSMITEQASPLELVVDNAGDLVVIGIIEGAGTIGGTPAQSSGSGDKDLWVARFDQAGMLEWLITAGGTNGDYASEVVHDQGNTYYVSGAFNSDDIAFSSGTPPGLHAGLFVFALDPDGSILWVTQNDGPGWADAHDITIGPDEALYVCGALGDGNVSLDTIVVDPGYGTDFFIGRLSDPSSGITDQRSEDLEAFPNPFASSITLSLPGKGFASLTVTDPMGHLVRRFGRNTACSLMWDGRTTSGTEVPPGMYLVTVIADGQRYIQRVIKQ